MRTLVCETKSKPTALLSLAMREVHIFNSSFKENVQLRSKWSSKQHLVNALILLNVPGT